MLRNITIICLCLTVVILLFDNHNLSNLNHLYVSQMLPLQKAINNLPISNKDKKMYVNDYIWGIE